jgi:hypothetical protein
MPENDPYAAIAEQGDPYAAIAEKTEATKLPEKTAKKPGYFTPENFQNLASEAGEREQEYQRRATYPGPARLVMRQGKPVYEPVGEQPTLASRSGAGLMSGVEAIVRVVDQVTAGLLDPKTAVAFLVSKVSPAAAGAYFSAQSTLGSKDAAKDIAKNGLTPENAERGLLSLAGIAGGASAGLEGSASPKPAGELLKGLKERAQNVARRVTTAKSGVTNAVVDAGDQYAGELGKNQQARREAVQENIDKDTKEKADIDRNERETAETNAKIEAENKASRDAVARKAELAKSVDEQSVAVGKSIEDVESKVYAAGDQKFKNVRTALGINETNKGPELPPEPLIETVKDIQKNVLQDIPENVKEFRAILNMEGEQPSEAESDVRVLPTRTLYGQPISETNVESFPVTPNEPVPGEELEPATPLTWDKLQSLKSRIDARLRSRGRINGDLKRGLFQARDAVVEQMGRIASQREGAAAAWQDARNFWREMKEDFHESTGPQGSASPVAQALNAVDPKNIRGVVLRTQSEVENRAVKILRKYREYGGWEAATQIEQLNRDYKEMTGLPKKAEVKPAAEAPKHKITGFKEVPEQPLPPTVNPEQVSRQAIQQTAERVGRLNVWDARIFASSVIAGLMAPFLGVKGGIELGAAYVVTKYLMSDALTKPNVINWIAKTPPSELAALRKLPQAQLVNIKNGITTAGELTKAKTISPELADFLGPENVKRILAASGAVAGSQQRKRKPPGEQKRDLQEMRHSNPALPVGVDQ